MSVSNTLIAMMGLPRSGKSTIAKQLSKLFGAPIVNRDAIRLAVHGQRYASQAEPLIKSLDIYMIRALFGAGHEIVICDETNYSNGARLHLNDPDKWTTVFYPVTTSKEVCQERAVHTGQDDLVSVIEDMSRRYTPLECCDTVFKKHILSSKTFIFESCVGPLELTY